MRIGSYEFTAHQAADMLAAKLAVKVFPDGSGDRFDEIQVSHDAGDALPRLSACAIIDRELGHVRIDAMDDDETSVWGNFSLDDFAADDTALMAAQVLLIGERLVADAIEDVKERAAFRHRLYEQGLASKAAELGCSVELARYIDRIEGRIDALCRQISELEG